MEETVVIRRPGRKASACKKKSRTGNLVLERRLGERGERPGGREIISLTLRTTEEKRMGISESFAGVRH